MRLTSITFLQLSSGVSTAAERGPMIPAKFLASHNSVLRPVGLGLTLDLRSIIDSSELFDCLGDSSLYLVLLCYVGAYSDALLDVRSNILY